MTAAGTPQALFAIFAISSQTLLTLFFVARRFRPRSAQPVGWITYAMGLPALALGVVFLLGGQPWYYTGAMITYAAWAGVGYLLDSREVRWRNPLVPKYFVPYIVLYTTTQLLLWIPLWWVASWLWIAYGLLYVVNTGLNLRGHFSRGPDVINAGS